jgi:hypothetical protein
MTKKIIYTRPDGGLSVVHPAEGARLAHGFVRDGVRHTTKPPMRMESFFRRWPAELSPIWAETEDEFIARIQAKDVPADASGVMIVDESAIPTDRSFRDAWKAEGAGIGVDFTKAQEITKERLRRERAPLLAALDVQFQRALETGADTAPIVAEKQRLRDVTKLADAATSLDELKALRP